MFLSFEPVAGGIQYSRDSTAQFAVFSTHGRDHSRDSTDCLARDTVSTGHHGKGLINPGIRRDALCGIKQPWDTIGRDSIMTGLHGMFCAGSSNHGTPQHNSCVPAYQVLLKTQSMVHLRMRKIDTPQG